MKDFDKFLDFIFTDKTASMYFYIVLGGLSLIFIILIIITLMKMKKEKQELEKNASSSKIELKPSENNNPSDNVLKEAANNEDLSKKAEAIVEPKDNEKPNEALDYGSETMTLNSILMDKEEIKLDDNENEDTVYLDKDEVTVSDYDFTLLNDEPVKASSSEIAKPIDDEDLGKILNDVQIDNLQEEKPLKEEVKLDTVTDDFLNDIYNTGSLKAQGELVNANDGESKNEDVVFLEDLVLKNEPKSENPSTTLTENKSLEDKKEEQPKETKSFVSNEELMKRLAKLRTMHKEENKEINETGAIEEDPELESIMKTVGLEDTMVIPNIKSEKQILGK